MSTSTPGFASSKSAATLSSVGSQAHTVMVPPSSTALSASSALPPPEPELHAVSTSASAPVAAMAAVARRDRRVMGDMRVPLTSSSDGRVVRVVRGAVAGTGWGSDRGASSGGGRSLLDRAGGEAGLPVALQEQERDHEGQDRQDGARRSEEHTSELQSRENLVCRLLLEKKKL